MINYVTYDLAGNLTGGYFQSVAPAHAGNHIIVSEAVRLDWTVYRADAQRAGVELLPVVTPAEALPEAIPMLNLHLVLIEDGHLETVEQAIAAMSGDAGQRARAYWAKALTARRDNEWVDLLWPQLYPDEAAFNDAWRRAAALNP